MPRRNHLPFALLACAATLGACSSTQDPAANWTVQRLYTEAHEEAEAGAFDKAVPLFEKLEGRAAGTPLAQQAQIEKAYAQYRNGDKVEAIATLERFMRLHPVSPALDYALYLKGLVNFNDSLGLFAWLSRQDLSERDQQAAKNAFESFSELATRFPDSRYAEDARLRMRYITNSLAQYEVHVARYYYQKGAYVAAIARAQAAIRDYRDAPALRDAMRILIGAYDALGMQALRDDARRVMRTTYGDSAADEAVTAQPKSWWKLW